MSWDDKWCERATLEKWLEPDPAVTRFARALRTDVPQRALDLGCGAGRHTVLLADHGYQTYASDASQVAVDHCREWLHREALFARVVRADMTDIAEPDDFYDLIVAFNVIYHTTFAGMRAMADLLSRKLRPGGHLFVTLKSPATWYFGEGVEIEPGTFRRGARPNRPSKELPVHFCTEAEADTLFSAFEIESKLHVARIKARNGKRLARWELTVRKPGPKRLASGD